MLDGVLAQAVYLSRVLNRLVHSTGDENWLTNMAEFAQIMAMNIVGSLEELSGVQREVFAGQCYASRHMSSDTHYNEVKEWARRNPDQLKADVLALATDEKADASTFYRNGPIDRCTNQSNGAVSN